MWIILVSVWSGIGNSIRLDILVGTRACTRCSFDDYINLILNNMYGREGRNLFQEASELGYLIRNSTGHPYILASGTYCSSIALYHEVKYQRSNTGTANFTFGTIDFTNPDAASWYSNVIRCNMLGLELMYCEHDGTERDRVNSDGWLIFAESTYLLMPCCTTVRRLHNTQSFS